MALQKTIKNRLTGHPNQYWRAGPILIDPLSSCVRLCLAGYASATQRETGFRPDDRRDWDFGPDSFSLLAAAHALPVSASDRAEIESALPALSPVVRTFVERALALRTFDAVARPTYQLIRSTRRPMPLGAVLQDGGDVRLPTGELIAAEDIEGPPEALTIPSEFADALDA